MISNMELKNIKCFSSAKFYFSPLTVFCGANSAGKSTAIQCILLLKQSFNDGKSINHEIALNGDYYSIGHVSDFVCHEAIGDLLSISIGDVDFSSEISQLDFDDYNLKLSKSSGIPDFINKDFHYLSAYRLEPKNTHELNAKTSRIQLGIYGEFTMSQLALKGGEPTINSKLAKEVCRQLVSLSGPSKTDEKDTFPLGIAVKEAMKEICPGFDIVVDKHEQFDMAAPRFSSNGTSSYVRPVNTGFGISYVLPIIVAALSTEEGGTLIVENPEVHLHPSAQSKLAAFLLLASLSGIQVIVETHSDHIINGLRVFVKENSVPEEHILINSIRALGSERIIKEIRILETGDFSDVDLGFLDQVEKDLLRLFL